MENSSVNMQNLTSSSTVVISIPREATHDASISTCDSKKTLFALSSKVLYYLKKKINFGNDPRKVIHSLKVGFALVLVSLFYFVDTLYKQVGENAMWAVMTVVVIFEFSAGVLASYSRLVPSFKKKFDYGAMIFILTFNLIAVSGLQGEKANFSRWEPWHGKFGFFYPWDKYLHLGDSLNELAASILSLKECVHSPRQPSSMPVRLPLKEPCETVASFVSSTLRELGESIKTMRIMTQQGGVTAAKLQKTKVELSGAVSVSDIAKVDRTIDGLAMASFVFSLMEILDKVEKLVKEVENLGDEAGFGHSGSDHVCNKGGKNKLLRLLRL
ncbi:hypothetical protein Sjap_006617 [Stephania japonica]|uniref:Aluminum-activated malate transporter n=1 Tax=Stephania japonica TaxID=461633 RepID=A0AAP0K7R4_9MAGN